MPSFHCDMAWFYSALSGCSGLCVLPCTTTQVAGSRDGCSPVSRWNTAEVELTQSGLVRSSRRPGMGWGGGVAAAAAAPTDCTVPLPLRCPKSCPGASA